LQNNRIPVFLHSCISWYETKAGRGRAHWWPRWECARGNCVEVARNLPGLVVVRDSKEPDGATLVVSREAWQIFIGSV